GRGVVDLGDVEAGLVGPDDPAEVDEGVPTSESGVDPGEVVLDMHVPAVADGVGHELRESAGDHATSPSSTPARWSSQYGRGSSTPPPMDSTDVKSQYPHEQDAYTSPGSRRVPGVPDTVRSCPGRDGGSAGRSARGR